mgnify:CR=1 FL=1
MTLEQQIHEAVIIHEIKLRELQTLKSEIEKLRLEIELIKIHLCTNSLNSVVQDNKYS